MKKNNFLVAIFVASLCFTNLFAQEVKPRSVDAPDKNEVVLVGRLIYKGNTYKEERKPVDVSIIVIEPDAFALISGPSGGLHPWTKNKVGKPFFFYAKPNKESKKVRLETFAVALFKNSPCGIVLPIMANVIIPEGAKYVYIGTFEYELDYAFRVKNVKRYDEYNDACEWIKIATGNDNVELIRAELEPLEEEDSKK
ncbi:hypothetical protein [Treponema sp.]|uniref:hypothetical protein n=1 Tax=Treponema sp. TaxID=166 RepID=UPI00298DC3EE|nr:hypothetical protein [Treponema sp.]MCR5612862.1 hypothetical protein [Treponema sp.]